MDGDVVDDIYILKKKESKKEGKIKHSLHFRTLLGEDGGFLSNQLMCVTSKMKNSSLFSSGVFVCVCEWCGCVGTTVSSIRNQTS